MVIYHDLPMENGPLIDGKMIKPETMGVFTMDYGVLMELSCEPIPYMVEYWWVENVEI